MSLAREQLQAAFEQTTYRVHLAPEPLDLRIGARHPALDAWLQTHGACRWVVFSPCNPGARLLTPAANAERMARLAAILTAHGLRHVPAEGIPPLGEDWPPEPSLLILDIPSAQTAALARQFGQLAWVAGERGQPAALVWSSPPRV